MNTDPLSPDPLNPDPLNMVSILYFARLAEQLNCRKESLELPVGVTTAGQLREYLVARSDQWLTLNDADIRIAVNQEITDATAKITGGDEVAFFPPVTGG